MIWLGIAGYVVLSISITLFCMGDGDRREGVLHKEWSRSDRQFVAIFTLASPIFWWLLVLLYIDSYHKQVVTRSWQAFLRSLNPLPAIGGGIEKLLKWVFPIKEVT